MTKAEVAWQRRNLVVHSMWTSRSDVDEALRARITRRALERESMTTTQISHVLWQVHEASAAVFDVGNRVDPERFERPATQQ